MNRVEMMKKAISLTEGTRQEDYGSFYQNMSDTADMFNAYLVAKYGNKGEDVSDIAEGLLTAQDAAFFMVIHKMVRTFQSEKPHFDNYIDGACYFAAAGEFAGEDYEDKQDGKEVLEKRKLVSIYYIYNVVQNEYHAEVGLVLTKDREQALFFFSQKDAVDYINKQTDAQNLEVVACSKEVVE